MTSAEQSTDSAASDPMIEMAERHQRVLREVAEIAMEVTRGFGSSAIAAAHAAEVILADEIWQPETGRARALAGSKDAAEAFHKVTRALRLTLALERATVEALRDLRNGVAPAPVKPIFQATLAAPGSDIPPLQSACAHQRRETAPDGRGGERRRRRRCHPGRSPRHL